MDKDAHIRSIGRSLAVLRAINQAGALSMMEIAKRCGIPYPTACRIVHTLQEEGMLERETARKYYRPTALVQSLSQGYQDHSDLVGNARSFLEDLTRKHFWPVSLTTRVGQLMIVRDCTHASSPMALTNYQPGATFPLIECASGHVMLAFCEEEERQLWLDAAAACDTPPDPLTLQRLRSDSFAHDIREHGFAMRCHNQFTNTPGRTSSFAVPIFLRGEVCGALTLVFFSVSMKLEVAIERYVPDLKLAAQGITMRLVEKEAAESSTAPSGHRQMQRAHLGVA